MAIVTSAMSLFLRDQTQAKDCGQMAPGVRSALNADQFVRQTKIKLLRRQLISSGSQCCLINNKKINSGSVPEFFFYG
jgi:hypothetical protein